MAGSFVQFAQNGGTATPNTCNKPTGTTSGDVMVAFHSTDFGTAAAMTAPAGWTLRDSIDNGTNSVHYKIWTKTAGGSEAATYDFAQGGGADGTVIIVTLRGVDETGAVYGTAANAAQTGTTFAAPTVTGTWPTDSVLLSYCMNEANNVASTYTPPAGMTECGDVQSTTWNCASAAYLLNPTDPTGTKTFTTSQSNWFGVNSLRQSVVFKASTAGAPRESVDITPLTATAWVTGTSPVSATYPGSLAENDIIYLICSSKPGGTAPTTPTNFTLVGSTQVGSGTAGVGTGPTQVTVFRRVAGASPPSGSEAVSLTSANVMSVCMQAYRASGTNLQWESEQWATGSAAASATPAIAVTVSASTYTAKDIIGWVVSVTDDTATAITHTSGSLTGITFGTDVRAPNTTEVSATGQDIGSAAFYVPITAGPNSGTTLTLTEAITASETSGVGVWRVRATQDVASLVPAPQVRPSLAALQRASW